MAGILTHPTMAERVRAAVLPIVPVCDPGVYRGNEAEYCTYQLTRQPTHHGDDMPHVMRYLVLVHWFLPAEINPEEKLTQLCRALPHRKIEHIIIICLIYCCYVCNPTGQ